MRVRAITVGVPEAGFIAEAGAAARDLRQRVQDAGFAVQTLRCALPPLAWDDRDVPAYARQAEARALEAGFEYLSIGPARSPALVDAAAEALLACPAVFASATIAEGGTVDLRMVWAAARAIARIGRASADGFGNLRFTASANVAPGGPFFPAGYHDGGSPMAALALECADLAVAAFAADTLEECRARLIARVEEACGSLQSALGDVAGLRFGGFDISLAPFPEDAISIGRALERLGIGVFGGPGTLAAAAFTTDALRAVRAPLCGFSGLMLPVLEDTALAERTAQGAASIHSLLAFSAVCGTGLDTVPLPGDATEAQLAGLLADVAALSAALRKPLTARLLPVPGKAAGQPTTFDFPYFVNGRVLALDGPGLGGALGAAAGFAISPRKSP